MLVEPFSTKNPIRRPARPAGFPGVGAMGCRVGPRSPRPHHRCFRQRSGSNQPAGKLSRGRVPRPRPGPHAQDRLVRGPQGRLSPAEWARDVRDSKALRWLGQGIQPSRSALYAFRDRLSQPVFDIHARAIRQAIAEGLTAAEKAVLDGTSVRSYASRHQLVNEDKLTKRLKELDAAVAQDAAGRPIESRPHWMAETPMVGGPNSNDTDGRATSWPSDWPRTKNAPRISNCPETRSKSASPTRRHPWVVIKRKSFVRCTRPNLSSIPHRC